MLANVRKKMRKPICSIMKCRFIGYVVLISQGIYYVRRYFSS